MAGNHNSAGMTRQEVLRMSLAAGAVAAVGGMSGTAAATAAAQPHATATGNGAGNGSGRSNRAPATPRDTTPRRSGARRSRPNILLIVTDQERANLPAQLPLPGHDWLKQRGTVFDNYFVHTAPCGPSRSTIYTGQHTQKTGVYLNPNSAPYPELPTSMPTLGTMLKQAGYRTAYKGKWHISNERRIYDARQIDYPNGHDFLKDYGFDEFNFDGDKIGLTLEGFQRDEATAADALDFVHRQVNDDAPWFMAVNFINPHDIMWFDATGNQEADRIRRNLTSPLMGAPGHPLYAKDWGIPLPHSFYNDDLSEKPVAHRAELASAPFFYGQMPHANVAAWERFQNYYFNCVIDVDRQLAMLLNGLEAAGEADNTIIIYTSDHGERAGAHGMRQKGSTVYDEDLRVPFYVVHPDVQGGHHTKKLASAVDIAPMLLTAAGLTPAQQAERWPDLKGVDITPALGRNGAATARDERGVLFSYAVGYGWTGGDVAPGVEMARPLPAPDKSLRRLHRGVFDGRYKFARYFAPNDHHTPTDWATLSAKNDLEMYDMEADPHELRNLAIPGRASQEQLLRLNAMTNALVAAEVGADDGSEYTGPYAVKGDAATPAATPSAASPAPASATPPTQGT